MLRINEIKKEISWFFIVTRDIFHRSKYIKSMLKSEIWEYKNNKCLPLFGKFNHLIIIWKKRNSKGNSLSKRYKKEEVKKKRNKRN